ncbi:MAG: hypothetical protein AB7O62_10615 [Pirellulales bacterium]
MVHRARCKLQGKSHVATLILGRYGWRGAIWLQSAAGLARVCLFTPTVAEFGREILARRPQ